MAISDVEQTLLESTATVLAEVNACLHHNVLRVAESRDVILWLGRGGAGIKWLVERCAGSKIVESSATLNLSRVSALRLLAHRTEDPDAIAQIFSNYPLDMIARALHGRPVSKVQDFSTGWTGRDLEFVLQGQSDRWRHNELDQEASEIFALFASLRKVVLVDDFSRNRTIPIVLATLFPSTQFKLISIIDYGEPRNFRIPYNFLSAKSLLTLEHPRNAQLFQNPLGKCWFEAVLASASDDSLAEYRQRVIKIISERWGRADIATVGLADASLNAKAKIASILETPGPEIRSFLQKVPYDDALNPASLHSVGDVVELIHPNPRGWIFADNSASSASHAVQLSPCEVGPMPNTTRSQSLVSIVTRTKNRSILLRRALRSVAGQTHRNIEHIIVSDGGDLKNLLFALTNSPARPPFPHVIHSHESNGMEAASNAGLALATGDYVLIHDDDDTLDPNAVEEMSAFLDNPEHHKYVGVVCHSRVILEKVEDHCIMFVDSWAFNTHLDFLTQAKLREENLFPPISFMYRRSVLADVGLYRDDLSVLGDWDFNLRVSLSGPIAVLPQVLSNYHWRADSTEAQSLQNSVTHGANKHARFRSLLEWEYESGLGGLNRPTFSKFARPNPPTGFSAGVPDTDYAAVLDRANYFESTVYAMRRSRGFRLLRPFRATYGILRKLL